MIIKKIKSNKPKRKGQHVSDLVRYIAEANVSDDHRIGLVGSRDFLTSTLDGQIAEMSALASECVKSKNPINHYVVSWREGENPSHLQLDEAVDILLKEMGLDGCQVIYAAHFDTKNIHLHLAVNRIDPSTLKAREINRGFDLDAGFQGIARVEHVQGWQPEAGALYHVVDGQVQPVGLEPGKERLPRGAKQAEVMQGEVSWARLAQERSEHIWSQVSSWTQLHEALEAVGLRYRKKGSGGVIEVGGEVLKATSVSRLASFSKLEKQIGPYEPFLEKNHEYITHAPKSYAGPPRDGVGHGLRRLSECHLAGNGQGRSSGLLSPIAQLDRRALERLRRESGLAGASTRGRGRPGTGRPVNDVPQWAEFQHARRERRQRLAAARLELSRQHEAEKLDLKTRQSEVRAQVLSGDWSRRGHQLNALRSAIREDHEVERRLLKERQSSQRQLLRDRLKPWPTWQEWLADQGAEQALEQVRYRRIELVFIVGIESVPLHPFNLRGFDWVESQDAIHYRRHGKPDVAFTDRGQHITVWNSQDDADLLMALQLAALKWQVFEVTGDDEFKQRCVRLAAQHGLPLGNAELQPALEAERIALGLPSPAPEEPTADRFPELLVIENEYVQKPEPSEPEEDAGYVM